MTKKIMSIAAIAAIFTTGAVAFETVDGNLKVNNVAQPQGTIVTEENGKLYKSSYTSATGTPANDLSVSQNYKGDALIYPAFNQKTGWGTEIVVRNTSNKAIVAKAVIYSSKDSKEVLDFNIYLSAKDVCRFKIENGKVTSTDGSIRSWGINPHQASSADRVANPTQNRSDFALIEFADKTSHPFEFPVSVDTGYVAIYGMEQSADGLNGTNDGFHAKHADLYAAYAQSLTDLRTEAWRKVSDNSAGAMVNGMFVKDVTIAPNLTEPDADTVYQYHRSNNTYGTSHTRFEDVSNVLTGQVRIYTEGRDVLLNATALDNFTDGTIMLWTEGEYASFSDRRLDATAKYDATKIIDDSKAFKISSAVYNYANVAGGDVENKLLLTQPFKRTIAQLGEATNQGYTGSTDQVNNKKVATGSSYNFAMGLSIFDEAENQNEEALAGTAIVSPRTTGAEAVTFNCELQDINATQLEELSPEISKNKNGFVEISDFHIPAIVTQMTASKAGSSAEINWVYADTIPQP
jgi:hypothetical protein